MGINGAKYILLNAESNSVCELMFEFYDCPQPKVGDFIEIDRKLTNKFSSSFVQPYAFEKLKHEPKQDSEADYACLEISGKKIYLERVYG